MNIQELYASQLRRAERLAGTAQGQRALQLAIRTQRLFGAALDDVPGSTTDVLIKSAITANKNGRK